MLCQFLLLLLFSSVGPFLLFAFAAIVSSRFLSASRLPASVRRVFASSGCLCLSWYDRPDLLSNRSVHVGRVKGWAPAEGGLFSALRRVFWGIRVGVLFRMFHVISDNGIWLHALRAFLQGDPLAFSPYYIQWGRSGTAAWLTGALARSRVPRLRAHLHWR